MTAAKQNAQTLVDDFMPLGRRMLTEYQEFIPFGGHIKFDGEPLAQRETLTR